jgi:hypothetical protein
MKEWSLPQKTGWALSILLVVIFLFSTYAEQQTRPTPEITKTITPTSTMLPTKPRTQIQTEIATPTPVPEIRTSDSCDENLVPVELLVSQPEIENNKLIACSTEGHSDIQ